MTKTVKILAGVVGGLVAIGVGVFVYKKASQPPAKYPIGYQFTSGGSPAKVTSRFYDPTARLSQSGNPGMWMYTYTYTTAEGSGEGLASEDDMGRMS